MAIISVIIPCYNVEKYVKRCFESLENQTIGIENMELIFVDDASTDNTWNIIQQFENMYPDNIIAIHCDENGRQGKARNIGMTYATAEYIGFVDSDDWVEPDMYEILLREMMDNNRDIVYCKFFRDDGSKPKEHKLDKKVANLLVDTCEKRKEFICSNCLGYGVWDKIYKKNFLIDNNIFFPENVAYEDIFFSVLYYMYAERIAIVNYELYHYFVNSESTVLKKNVGYHDDILMVLKLRVDEYKRRKLLSQYREEIELDILLSGFLAALKVMFLRYDSIPYEMYTELCDYINAEFPKACDNIYIGRYIPEKYRILLPLLKHKVSNEDLEKIADSFRLNYN